MYLKVVSGMATSFIDLENPDIASAVEMGLAHRARMRVQAEEWRGTMEDIRRKCGDAAVHAIHKEVNRRQMELDVDSLRRRLCLSSRPT